MKKKKIAVSFLTSLLASSLFVSCGNSAPSGQQAGSSPYAAFTGQQLQGEKNFAKLINGFAKSKPDKTPWAGYWWPYKSNGIAGTTSGGSPAGKYDAARGGTSYAQAWEANNHGPHVKNVGDWWGHCNGWCAASALLPEPSHETQVNGVTFGVADIKALLSEAGMSVNADFFGERVDPWDPPNTPKYDDTIPDQYFLVLTNFMGIQKQVVLIDRYTGDQVWNQPLVGYEFEYPKPSDYSGADPAAPNVYRITLNSKFYWVSDEVSPDIQTPDFNWQDEFPFAARSVRLELWLDGPVVFDANGQIVSSGNVIVTRNPTHPDLFIGGTWKMGEGYMVDAWPDYMWVPHSFIRPDYDQDYANPEIDIQWIKDHVLTSTDDPNFHGIPVPAPPHIDPTPHPDPSPHPRPSP